MVIATYSSVKWNIVDVFIATYTEARYKATAVTIEKEKVVGMKIATPASLSIVTDPETLLKKTAKVLLKNNFGEEKIIEVDLKWDLKKRILPPLPEKIGEKQKSMEDIKNEYGLNDLIEEKTVTTIATDTKAQYIEKLVTENEELKDKQIILIDKNDKEALEEIQKELNVVVTTISVIEETTNDEEEENEINETKEIDNLEKSETDEKADDILNDINEIKEVKNLDEIEEETTEEIEVKADEESIEDDESIDDFEEIEETKSLELDDIETVEINGEVIYSENASK